jgi:phospholipid/cholesterol/gamma-HCH transport system permease protein
MSSASFKIRTDAAGSTVALSGDWTSLTMGNEVAQLPGAVGATCVSPIGLDISGLGRLDTAGAYAILRAIPPEAAADATLSRPDVAHLFELVRPVLDEPAVEAKRLSSPRYFFEQTGRAVVSFAQESLRIFEFAGELSVALARTLRHPSRLRGVSLVRMMETAGINALPIVIIMNFFIGAVVALVGTNLLASLGVSVFTVELVGVAVLREFSVLITGILLAGRSASSFAAQIGTMKMTQEIDAMTVMGVDEFDALVVPRVLALLLIMPLLVFAAMAAGIIGGLIVSWLALDMSPVFFLSRMKESVDVRHFWIGMSKVPLLAMLIAMAGCRHGLFVKGDVESLGMRVTGAVVQAIFMIILFDAVFAVIYMELNL